MSLILGWFTSTLAGPVAAGLAILLAAGFTWQTAQIDGWPVFGGGYKAEVAALELQAANAKTTQATFEAAALLARRKSGAAAQSEARAETLAQAAAESRMRTIIRKVPVYVTNRNDAECIVPWGAVRLLDAAASGADPDSASALVAPGQPDDAASDVKLSEAVALLAADLGIARQNADQLSHLENAIGAQK